METPTKDIFDIMMDTEPVDSKPEDAKNIEPPKDTDTPPADEKEKNAAQTTDDEPSGGTNTDAPPKDTPPDNPPVPPAKDEAHVEFEKIKADNSALTQRCVALEREVAFYKEQEQLIASDPKGWVAQNLPSLLAPPIDIDKELEKEFGADFIETEYQPGAKAGTKSFKYDMRRVELYNQVMKAGNLGEEFSTSVAGAKKIQTEGFDAIDKVVTDLKTQFKVDDAYITEKLKAIAEYSQKNPYKAAAFALDAMVKSENLTLERAKEIVAKDELLKKEKGKVKPTPPPGRIVSKPVDDDPKTNEKDESGFMDLIPAYKNSGFV